MISTEYRAVVDARNILRTRIMLKDSMVVEPSCLQFNEMLSFARRRIPEIIVPFDGEALEMDSTKWTHELMNMELVQIVNNFSVERIHHLQKVIGVVLADEIRRSKAASKASYNHGTFYGNSMNGTPKSSEEKRQEERRKALGIITSAGNGVGIVMERVKSKKGSWIPSDVAELEEATKKMMTGIRKYKENK